MNQVLTTKYREVPELFRKHCKFTEILGIFHPKVVRYRYTNLHLISSKSVCVASPRRMWTGS